MKTTRLRDFFAAQFAGMLGVWLCFDGARALLVGDYVTPATGPYAGQLGPWATLLGSLGLDPRSTTVKSLHLASGVMWVIAATALERRTPRRIRWTAAAALASLWYLPFGTLAGLAGLLYAWGERRSDAGSSG